MNKVKLVMKRFPIVLAAVLCGVIAWSAYKPAEWGMWWMEMSWVLGAFALLSLCAHCIQYVHPRSKWRERCVQKGTTKLPVGTAVDAKTRKEEK